MRVLGGLRGLSVSSQLLDYEKKIGVSLNSPKMDGASNPFLMFRV